MSQIALQILHQDYLLTCPDGQESQLLEAVERVEQQFQRIRSNSKLRSRERVGVLLAVNLAYENLELRQQLQALQEQLASAQEQADALAIHAEREARLQALQAQADHDASLARQLAQRLEAAMASACKSMEPTASAPPILASLKPHAPDEAGFQEALSNTRLEFETAAASLTT